MPDLSQRQFTGAALRPDGVSAAPPGPSSSSGPIYLRARASARRCGWSPMRSGCRSTRWRASGELATAQPETTDRRRHLGGREVLLHNGSPSPASARAGHLIQFRATWYCTDGPGSPMGKSARQGGMCRSTATRRWRSLSGCRSPRPHGRGVTGLLPPTGRSTPCRTSARAAPGIHSTLDLPQVVTALGEKPDSSKRRV